jgi:hypothetical protein
MKRNPECCSHPTFEHDGAAELIYQGIYELQT